MKNRFDSVRFLTAVIFLFVITAVMPEIKAKEHSSLLINEFLSSNNEIVRDEDGDYEDWIEILNTGEHAVSLRGYALTDTPGREHVFRWVFPDTTLEAGEFLIVWASGKDRRMPGAPLHTGFRIDSDGEPLRLSDHSGIRLDTIPPVAVPTDYSYGRIPDDSDQWVFFSDPTPGGPNVTDGAGRLLDPPEFSMEGGFYERDFYLKLSPPDHQTGTEIYYTADGSRPGPDNGMVYKDSIHIDNRTDEPNDISMIPTNNLGEEDDLNDGWKPPVGQVFKATVIRAVSVAPDAEPVETATKTYFVGNDLDHRYRLPVVSLATDREHFFSTDRGIYVPDNFWKSTDEWERPVHFEFFETGGEPAISQDAGVRIHGGTSRGRPIKSLRMYARRSYGETWFMYPFIPEAPVERYKRFILRNSGNDWDKSYFRDALMQELIAHTGVETQYYRPVLVFLNGEYWGIHNIRKRFDHRYFETMYGFDRDNLVLLEGDAAVKEGTYADRQDYLDLRDQLKEEDVNDPKIWNSIRERMDLDNFRDYHIAQIYYRNTDWPGNNIDYWRKRTDGLQEDALPGHDGRWRWLMYDTDFGFNLDYRYVPGVWDEARHNTLQFAVDGSGDDWPNPQWSVQMLRGTLRNDAFRHDFINRFAGLLNTAFSEERVSEKIDEMYEALAPHMEEHIRRWSGPETIQDWEDQVETMRTFARDRPDYQRAHIHSYFSLNGTMEITLDVNNSGGGHISVHDTAVKPGEVGVADDPWPWTGTYFKDVPVAIRAEPAEGYKFAGWEGRTEEHPELIIRSSSENLYFKALFELTDVSSEQLNQEDGVPEKFSVSPVRPNPFNNLAIVPVSLPENRHVSFKIFTIDGRRVETVYEGSMHRGTDEIRLDASNWSSGIYIAVIEAGPDREVFPLTLIK